MGSADILRSLAECRWDIPKFSRDILGIRSHPGQDELFDAVIRRDSDGVTAEFLTIPVSAGNRAGKTLGLDIVILHSTLYKMGMRPPVSTDQSDLRRWSTAPYDWYHFGMSQDVADLTHLEMTRVLQGVHEAQGGRGCPLTTYLGHKVASLDRKEKGEWAWFKWDALFGGGEVHFRTTSEKALGTLGRNMNGWSWDEAAFDPNLLFIFDEVLNLRRMSTGGQGILIGTATEGSHQYEELWERGSPVAPDRQPDYFSLRMSTRQNIGYGVSQDMFDRMLRTVPATLVPQNIDGHFIEARKQYFASVSVNDTFDRGIDLPEHEPASSGRRYVTGIDPALTYDSTWAITLDISDPNRWVGVHAAKKSGRQTAEGIVGLAVEIDEEYGEWGLLSSGVDATGFGGKVFRSLLASAGVNVVPIEFGGKSSVKLRLLSNTRSALESGRLVLPKSGIWLILRRQLLGYQLADRKIQTDAVMALVVSIRMALRALAPLRGAALEFDFFGTGPVRPKPLTDAPAVVPSRRQPRPVDDRMLRLDTLATATVAPMGRMFPPKR